MVEYAEKGVGGESSHWRSWRQGMKGEEGNGVSAGSGNKLRKRRFRSIVELGQWPKKDADWCPDFRRRQHSIAVRVEKLTTKKR